MHSLFFQTRHRHFQKLLHYILKGYKPENICQTLNYADQHEYWKKREECIQIITDGDKELGEDLQVQLKKVYEKYTSIRNDFLKVTDIVSEQKRKKKIKRKWIITGFTAVILPLVFFLFVYPRIIQKDFQILFDYGVESSGYEMTIDSTDLLDEMIFEEEMYTPESYWLLSLKALQEGDPDACMHQLKSLKASDRNLYNEKGKYILKRLKY